MTYEALDIVKCDGVSYIALETVSGESPPQSEKWQALIDTDRCVSKSEVLRIVENAISNITYRSVDDYGAENYGGYLVYDMGDNLVEPLANLAEEFL